MEVENSFSPNQQDGEHSGHRGLYKRTPKGWKERFRKGCIQRLRQNRNKLVEKLRASSDDAGNMITPSQKSQEFINELMNAEFKEIKDLDDGKGEYLNYCFNQDAQYDEEGLDNMLQVMDEIRQELIREEQAILKEYDELVRFDEKSLCAAIEGLGPDYVTCPVCRRGQLLQNKQILFCSCGLRIDTGYDGITLSHVKRQIEEAVKQHSYICGHEAIFSILLIEELELHNLVLKCEACKFMEIVI